MITNVGSIGPLMFCLIMTFDIIFFLMETMSLHITHSGLFFIFHEEIFNRPTLVKRTTFGINFSLHSALQVVDFYSLADEQRFSKRHVVKHFTYVFQFRPNWYRPDGSECKQTRLFAPYSTTQLTSLVSSNFLSDQFILGIQ